MDSFTLLYLFYFAKLGSQSSTWFIWRAHSTSASIPYIAAVVTTLAVIPLFHVIVHISMSKPLSYPILVAYLCFSSVLAFLWYEPMRESRSILLFALVTSCDLTALLIFLLPRAMKRFAPEIEENQQHRDRLLNMEAGQAPSPHARLSSFAPPAPSPTQHSNPDILHERPRGQDLGWTCGPLDNAIERVVEPVSGFSASSTSPIGAQRDVECVTVPSLQDVGPRTSENPQLDIGSALGDVGDHDTRNVEEIRFADRHTSRPGDRGGREHLRIQLSEKEITETHPYFRPPKQSVLHLDTSQVPSTAIQTPRGLGTPFEPREQTASAIGNVI